MIMWGSTRPAIKATTRAAILAGLLVNDDHMLTTSLEKRVAARRRKWKVEKEERKNGDWTTGKGRREEFLTLGKKTPMRTMKTQTERRRTKSKFREAAVADVM
jgi:hypothetical protein